MVSDDHKGLVAGLTRTLEGASWQRCYVHFLRNVNAQVPKARAGMVIELLRTIFAQNDEATARAQLRFVADKLSRQEPEVSSMLLEAEPDLLSHYAFPAAHRKQLRSTNPLERLNKEIKRRGDAFPTERQSSGSLAPCWPSNTMNGRSGVVPSAARSVS